MLLVLPNGLQEVQAPDGSILPTWNGVVDVPDALVAELLELGCKRLIDCPDRAGAFFRGQEGAQGASAFMVARACGFAGSEEQWLASLHGKDGAVGPRGASGRPGIDGKDGAPGARGPRGPMPDHEWRGTELRFQKPDGSWGEFVDLQGPPGEIRAFGVAGPAGPRGADGAQGPQGPTGPTGPQGPQGPQGPPGTGGGGPTTGVFWGDGYWGSGYWGNGFWG